MKPILDFNYPIDADSIDFLIKQLRSANAPDTVLIDSPGGSFDFFSIRGPAIARMGITTVADRVYSAAAILFCLGAKRIVHPESEILFHEVRVVPVEGRHITVSDMESYERVMHEMRGKAPEHFEEFLQQMKSAQEWLIQFIAQRTSCPTHVIRHFVESDTTLSGKEAYRYGIATEFASAIKVF